MTTRIRLFAMMVIALLLVTTTASASQANHRNSVAEAIQAMGGDALTNLVSLRADVTGTKWLLDEGFAPDSPPVPIPYKSTISLDIDGDQQRTDSVIGAAPARTASEVVTPAGGFVDGQDLIIAPPFTAPMLSDRWASTRLHQRLLNPHLLLLDALANPSTVTQRRNLLIFDTGGAPLYVKLNRRTGLPTKAWTVESDPVRRDVSLVVKYRRWSDVDGLMVPERVDVRYDRKLVQREVRTNIELNVDLDPALFDFPPGIEPVFDEVLAQHGVVRHQRLQAIAAFGFPETPGAVTATELSPGVYHLTGGSHNSLAVVQQDGVVLAEAPLDEVRATALLDWITTNIGLPVTHVINSHHHPDHAGGVRSVANTGAVTVVHEDAKRFFRHIYRAPSTLVPYPHRSTRRPLPIIAVPDGGSYTINDPINPVGVHTITNDHASDTVLVDAGGVLFVNDLYSPGFPSPDAEVVLPRVLELRLGLDTVAGGHGATIPWEDFVALFQ